MKSMTLMLPMSLGSHLLRQQILNIIIGMGIIFLGTVQSLQGVFDRIHFKNLQRTDCTLHSSF